MIKKYNKYYIVKKNDNLINISRKYKINPIKILLENNLTPEMIREGRVLYIN